MSETQMIEATGYTTYGSVRGQGKVRATYDEALRDLAADQRGCRRQGGYSDREAVVVGDNGYLYSTDDGSLNPERWIATDGGTTNGGVRVQRD